jgi:hypothetical protein
MLGCQNHPMPHQRLKEVLHRHRWLLEAFPHSSEHANHFQGTLDGELSQELVWGFSNDPKCLQHLIREVAQVPSQNLACTAGYRGRNNMTVVLVGQIYFANVLAVVLYQWTWQDLMHWEYSAAILVGRNVRLVHQQMSNPFVRDLFRPLRLIEALCEERDQQISREVAIEDVRVQDHLLAAHLELPSSFRSRFRSRMSSSVTGAEYSSRLSPSLRPASASINSSVWGDRALGSFANTDTNPRSESVITRSGIPAGKIAIASAGRTNLPSTISPRKLFMTMTSPSGKQVAQR